MRGSGWRVGGGRLVVRLRDDLGTCQQQRGETGQAAHGYFRTEVFGRTEMLGDPIGSEKITRPLPDS